MVDVFISYSREDRPRAEAVAAALAREGVDAFWDSEIPPGQTWADYIEAKLRTSRAVIVLWSEHSTKSQWVREEARIGREAGKLIPIMLDNSPAPFGFGEVQGASLSSWNGEADHPDWRRVVAALRAALDQKAPPRPAPAPNFQPAPPPAPPPLVEPAAAPAKRRTWLYVAGGAVAAIVALGVIGVIVENQEQAPSPEEIAAYAGNLQPPAAAAATTPVVADPAQAQAEVVNRLTQVGAVLGQQGFQPVGGPLFNALAPGGGVDAPTPLTIYPNFEVRVAAVCDQHCGDLDLHLFNANGQQVSADNAPDNHPIVSVGPGLGGLVGVRIVMAQCAAAQCYFGAQVYARPAQ